ncbi:ABC transporter ATP-binding protein [Zavarzinia sp.]|uniref:ABC transporter ATP-binding protein n=1 Tax=Zavarzinia sp. TaxID=2027920 RepID=UPI003BB77275
MKALRKADVAEQASEGPEQPPLAVVDRGTGLFVDNVTKQFGGVYAVRDVTLACEVGQIVGLIGPNGAGKTTLMNLISGTLTPSAGNVYLGGVPLGATSPETCAEAGIARTFQNIRLFKRLTVRENVEVASITFRRLKREGVAAPNVDEILDLLGLSAMADLKAGHLPYGHQRRVEIARALALAPRIILLDEPAAGMNEQESHALISSVRMIRDRFGCGVVVIEHDLKFIMEVSELLYVMHLGAVIVSGPPEEVRHDERVIEVYLGRKARK